MVPINNITPLDYTAFGTTVKTQFAWIPHSVQQGLLQPHGFAPHKIISSGLSAATIVQCSAPDGRLACLRRWPHSNREKLTAIHRHLRQLSERGIDFTPAVYCSDEDQPLVSCNHHLWELTSWLPGNADYLQHPTDRKLLAAVQGLAQIHHVWSKDIARIPSPTVRDRLQRLLDVEKLIGREFEILAGCRSSDERLLVTNTLELWRNQHRQLAFQLSLWADSMVAAHFVQRDIWSDHLLFTDETLSGIVDFGAARIDDPLTDLVRMLSSCEPYAPARIKWAFDVYLETRQSLGRFERDTTWDWNRFQVLDQVATLLSAVQWMEWLSVEHRSFQPPRDKLLARWSSFVERSRMFDVRLT